MVYTITGAIIIDNKRLNALLNNFFEYEKFKRILGEGKAELDENELMNVAAARKGSDYSDFITTLKQKHKGE